MLRWMLGVALALAVAAAPQWAEAQAGADAEARALFQAGQVAFSEGRFDNALEYFRRSYQLSRRPQLLYNIGAAADRLRLDAEALEAFEQYLAAEPDSPNRAEVESRIAVLRRSVAAGAAATAEPTTPPEGTASSSAGGGAASSSAGGDTTRIDARAGGSTGGDATTSTTSMSTTSTTDAAPAAGGGPGAGPWIVLGVGAAVAVAGAVLVGLAASDVSAVENASAGSSWSAVRDAYDRSEPMSIAGFVLLGVGVAAATAGLAWGIAGGSGGEAEIAIGPGGAAIRGSF